MTGESDRLDRESEAAIARTLQAASRSYPAPIWWCSDPRDAATILHCGTCFFVSIGNNRFGVTAHHVIAQFLTDRDKFPDTMLMIRNTEVPDWDSRRIDCDGGLDLATFRVSDAEFASIGVTALHSDPERWPPPPPAEGKGLVFTGYPGEDRRVMDKKSIEFVQSSNGVVLASVGSEELEITIDPAFLVSIDGAPIASTTKNLGGYSGAPVLVVSENLAGPLFWLGGIVIRQLPAKDERDTTRIWARRPNCIRPDGQLANSRHVTTDRSGI
jgi:hypothetical protein